MRTLRKIPIAITSFQKKSRTAQARLGKGNGMFEPHLQENGI
jgi:hypothetical protein